MKAERTLDYGIVIQIISQMFDNICEDGVSAYIPDVVNENWVLLYEDELIGMYRIHQLNAITHQIHAFILPDKRKEHAKESGSVILDWCLENMDFKKLIAEIPTKYMNVYHFTKSQGFKDEGVNRMSFLKDNKIWDTYRLGMTREEVVWSQQ